MGAVVTSQSEDVPQGNTFTLEPASDVKDNEEFESEHRPTVPNDALIQNELGK